MRFFNGTILTCLITFGLIDAVSLQANEMPTPSQRFGQANATKQPSFRQHIIPLLGVRGCNGRECHGSFAGKGDFQLSLFGYDFDKDHKELVAKNEGPRTDADTPEESLLLLKPTMQEKHRGKLRFKTGSWEYHLILNWIKNGAVNDSDTTPDFDRLEVKPTSLEFSKTGQKQKLQVIVHWKDGTSEDITELTRFRSNDESIATVNEEGVVTITGKGDTHIIAFYDNGVQPVPVTRPVSDQVGEAFPDVATSTKVDELIVAKLQKLGVVPSPKCSDEEFLRRVSLDLTGSLPLPPEIRKFVASKSKDKRNKKIEQLLNRPGYAAWWTTKLCDFTGNNPQNQNDPVFRDDMARHWYEWIYHRVKTNAPYDNIAEGLIMATSRQKGENFLQFAKGMSQHYKKENPTPFHTRDSMPYYWARRNVRQAEEKALSFAHSFLGVRIQCAQCHKHPFDQWTQQDFKKFQAFFEPIQFRANTTKADKTDGTKNYQNLMKEIETAVGYDKNSKNNNSRRQLRDEIKRRAEAGQPVPWQELYIANSKSNSRKNKNRNKKRPASRVITPSVLGGDNVHLTEYNDPRQPLMDWLRSEENPYFAQAFVNRVWFNYFGKGIVHPVDDMNLANPPSNKPLMDYLTKGFVESGYDMKWLHRTILQSDAYQRSWRPNETNKGDERNFSRMAIRRLPAEVVTDAITQATASKSRVIDFATTPVNRTIGPDAMTRKNKNVAAMAYALNVFGKPERAENCDCERSNDPTLLQAIFTRNDPTVNAMIEGRDRKNPGWISELDQYYNGTNQKAPKSKNSKKLKELYEQRRKLVESAPKRPKNSQNKKAVTRFATASKEHRQKIQKLNNSIRKLGGANRTKKTEVKPLTPEVINRLIDETFLRTVSRFPTPLERAKAKTDIDASKNKIHGIKDLLWALLNTKEFLVNH